MKLFILICLLALIGATGATAASAARDPRVPALQQQVAKLKRDVAILANAIIHDEDLSTCRFIYQSHFNFAMLDLIALGFGLDPVADSTPSDQGACQRVGIAPPTNRSLASARIDPFGSLVAAQLRINSSLSHQKVLR